jgi:hypothetical protein
MGLESILRMRQSQPKALRVTPESRDPYTEPDEDTDDSGKCRSRCVILKRLPPLGPR